MYDLAVWILQFYCLVFFVTLPLVYLKRRFDQRALAILVCGIVLVFEAVPVAIIAACSAVYGSCHFVPPVPQFVLRLLSPVPALAAIFALPAFFGRRKAPLGTLPRGRP